MTITDHVGRPFEHSSVTRLSVIGAIFYALWVCCTQQDVPTNRSSICSKN
jgi:hypothetical protein